MCILKKSFDLSLSLIGLLVMMPLMLLIGLFIYLDSPGNVIFSQARLGKNGRTFFMHKFRKFPVDWGTKGPGVTTSGDVRMTAVGRVLERTKLDELPQLWNIAKGEMSFVGPRPESLRYKDLFVGKYKQVLEFIPGIFGPNQVVFRNESQMYPGDVDPEEFYQNELFPQKAVADIDYFKRSTFLSDLSWLIQGLYGTFSGIVNWDKFIERHLFVILIDVVLIELSWSFAHWFRFGYSISPHNISVYLSGCWLLPLIMLPIMMMGGCYRHPVRYFSNVKIIGYIDEDEDLRGRYINGYKVLGTWRDLDVITQKMLISEFWISQPIQGKDDVVIQSWAERNNIKPVFLYNIDAFSSFE